MSRYISAWRKLVRQLEKLEKIHGVGDLGTALANYSETGELPANPLLRERVMLMEKTAEEMASTVPPPTGAESCSCGLCQTCQSARPWPMPWGTQGHNLP
jgi:hypothetical protein